ncbi:MAG TPA: isoprenylcysteine carboxylmethyltransferase family protein [Povalibacter sp.]|jgi:protein-S-isoprenylcysteine O-methyltransferase Ste14|uniref:methyltransferase family protein n=1 Tax=Povalibacter sp. TaxID=1962978 RepID=UPI002B5E3C19|nr:isoprenylcysteine carboxylmethyltransferase family protein [Povalibacter sp.]HMN47247.1 isoprenylcysteine carboxylmethyltransferase family protein [Povalibacter sp.]
MADTRAFCLVIVALFLISRSAWHESSGTVAHVLTPIGIVLAAIGALGRLWCSSYMAGNKNVQLVRVGPYSLTRNPLYVFSFLGGLGITITTETLTLPVLFMVWFAWYYRDVIQQEEVHLGDRHGARFVDYRASVPRFWPRLSGYWEPGRWEVCPAALRRSLTEVVWFVIAAVIVHALHDLRDVFAWPSLFALY